MKGAKKFQSIYLKEAHGNLEDIAEAMVEATGSTRYDTLVGTGLSGALVVPGVARMLDKHWLIVRKQGDSTHSHLELEGTLGNRWLFLDDLISTGTTYTRVKEVVGRYDRSHAGAYLYADQQFRRAR